MTTDAEPVVARERTTRADAAWALMANLAITGTAGLLVLALPFWLTPQEYGSWQLYLTLSLWLSFVTFGIPEGAFVRYAGRPDTQWPRSALGAQTVLLAAVFAVILALACLPVVLPGGLGPESMPYRMLLAALLSALVFVPRTLLATLLQAQRRFKAFAAVVLVERVGLVALTAVAVWAGVTDPWKLAGADIVAKLAGLGLVVVLMAMLFRRRPASVAEVRQDAGASMRIGMALVVANLAGIALHTIPRLAIERGWGLATFGHVALAFSAAMSMMVLFNALSAVSFPDLAGAPDGEVRERYLQARRRLAPWLAISLLTAFPIMAAVEHLLPDYADAARYLGWLYPVLVFEAKAKVISANYLKRIGAERTLLAVNVSAVGLSLVLAALGTYWLHDLRVVMFSLVAVVALRGAVADRLLAGRLGVPWRGWAGYEWGISLLFLLAVWRGGYLTGAIMYAVVLGVLALGVTVLSRQRRGTTSDRS